MEKYDYSDKLITVDDALKMVKSGDEIATGLAIGVAKGFMSQLHTIADKVTDVRVNASLCIEPYEFLVNPRYSKSFMTETWFLTPPLRKARDLGACSYMPCHLQYCAKKRVVYRTPDIFIGTASMPDRNGFVTLSLSNSHEIELLNASKIKILEINPNYPAMYGDHLLHVRDVDYLIEQDYHPPVYPDSQPNEKDMIIGKLIADKINDGDCIQLGIGGIPDAVAASLYGKKDLGVHTELFTTGMMKLAKAGVITNAKKNLNNHRAVTAFVMGTEELYEYVTDNPSIMVCASSYTNNPDIIRQNDNMVSINTSLEVDVTGQCCSESIGSKQFSGTGGQTDTAAGAQLSKNGKSFIALYSTAMVKNPKTGEKEEISKIVSQLKPGAIVSLTRNDLDYLVTEYGIVRVKGLSVADRVEKIISIAHPKFRQKLWDEAYEYGIIWHRPEL
ncbi:MAG: acetyl-CoA hydrolase/transferase C-terminal domain-containing protein [Clostridia bacterium]|nr:acetyl-CoA hydrolase/transferase C-terminal domain-containing protein [Clostridia bacterium]